MVRVWLLFFTIAFSVSFRLFNPDRWVNIPYPTDFDRVPEDVFYYHLLAHFGEIILAVIMISIIVDPIDKKYLNAFVVYIGLLIVDMVLYRLYYRDWAFKLIPWNIVKTFIFAIVTAINQCKRPAYR